MPSPTDAIISAASRPTVHAYRGFVATLSAPFGSATDDSLVSERDEVRATALSQIRAGLDKARLQLAEALDQTAPSAALIPLHSRTCVHVPHAVTSRFAWLLATSGCGTRGDEAAWNRYAQACATWLGEYVAHHVLSSMDENSLSGIGLNSAITRLLPGSTEARWISDRVCASLGRWVDLHEPAGAADFGSRSLTAVNASAAALLSQKHGLASRDTFEGIGAGLMSAIAAHHRAGESSGFEHRLLSTEPEFAPLVLIDGHLQAVNTAAWYAGREIAVFAAVRERLGSRVMGEAYEAVVRDVFASVGPTGFDLAPSEALAPPPGLPADPDETDLVASTAQSMVIVEAKAYLPARTPRAVGNSYSDQLLHSRKQVRTRLAHWDQGWTFRGRPELPRDIDAYGLSVPIHDYGGSTWRGDSMREAEVDPCVVMPLQALALALSCMRTPDEFGRYLAFRLSLMRAPHAGLDELEPLIAWLAADGSPDAVPEYDHGLSVFRSYALPTGFQLGHPGPKDRDEWIELVYSHAEPLDGGSLHTKDGMVDVGELCERWSSHVRRALASGRPVSITRAADRATWSVALSSAVVRRVIVESTLIAATAGEVAPPSRASLPDPAMSPEHRAIRKEAKRLLRATSRQPHSSLPTPRSHVITSPETTTTLILEIVGQSRRPRNARTSDR